MVLLSIGFLLPLGDVITNPNEVAKVLIDELKKLQTTDKELTYSSYIPFPELPILCKEDCKELMRNISTNKALALDGISDILFKEENIDQSREKLYDLWNINWSQVPRVDSFFKNRLIPLNKNHPKLPGPKDFRPIVVSSPVVKLLEARLLPKIRDYLKNKLYRGQIGFTPGLGTSVNIHRLSKIYTNLTQKNEKAYALFLDFKSAYNSVLHSKLFKRLRKVLDDQEIQLIQAIYSRQSIANQGYRFTPNCGVAQGSLISPGLFNIYVEPLYKKIEKQGVSEECIMAYADDLLVVCSSINQLRRVIHTVQNWCEKNNFKLNESKSGVVELLPRIGPFRPSFKENDKIEGIPVVKKYKYLGTWITSKFSMDAQLTHMKHKIDFLSTKLFPLLHDASLSLRINLWEVFAKPLFDQLAHLYHTDKAKTNKFRAERLLKYSFKRFTLLAKSIPDQIIYHLSGYSLANRALIINSRDEFKLGRRMGKDSSYPSLETTMVKCNAILPKEFSTLINLTRSLCRTHPNSVLNPDHIRRCHEIQFPSYEVLLSKMEAMVVYKTTISGGKPKRQLDRLASLKATKKYVNKIIPCLLELSASRAISKAITTLC